MSRPACSRTASTTRGWQWPSCATDMPVRKSRYSLPSSSQRRVPSPLTNSTGLRAYVAIRASRSSDCSSASVTTLGPQLRADALVGEQLEQERVRLAPVEDVGVSHAGLQRVHCRLELRAHSAGHLV